MNDLLIFFALPIAVVVISIALQKLLRCPWLVAAIIFSIFLNLAVSMNNLNLIFVAIAYTIISYITAIITCLIHRYLRRCEENNNLIGENESKNLIVTGNSEMLENNGEINDNNNCYNCNNGYNYRITDANGISTRN